jgi:hypothetical protein
MKSIKALFVFGCLFLLGSIPLFAQVPQAFSYQAVARDASGEIKANADIRVQVRILQGSEDGTVLYTETHSVRTSEIGSFSLEIGRGTSSESFSGINWIDGPHYLAMGVDLNGGTNYVDVGSTKLLSVPFAIMSQTTVSGGGAFPESVTLNSDNGDTSFRLTSEGSTRVDPLIVTAQTGGANTAISGVALPAAGNSNQQRAVQGFVNGDGSGLQIGVLGSAYNLNGTGDARYGLYGQSASKGVQNLGLFALAAGEGNGNVQTDFNSADIGSVNSGAVGFATGNLNFNLGVRGRAYGSAGARENVGVQGHSEATASGRNIGVQAIANGSQSLNIGILSLVGFVGNTQDNIGMQLFVRRGGARSIGAEIHADKAILTYGDVEVNGNISYTGSLAQTSDLRLKDNIRSLNNGLDVIMQLNPASYTYKWNTNGMGMTLSRGQHYGLIAQDVEKILPALVQANTHRYQVQENNPDAMSPDGSGNMVTKEFEYKSLNYTELIPFLIKAVQEQQAMIEAQQKEIETLKKLIDNK